MALGTFGLKIAESFYWQILTGLADKSMHSAGIKIKYKVIADVLTELQLLLQK